MAKDKVLLGQERARQAIEANLTERYYRLDRLDQYVDGTQYEGRPNWFDTEKPLMERAPCIIFPMVKSVYTVITSTVLGEGRWPTITTRPGEDDEEEGDETAGLSPEDSLKVDKLIRRIEKCTRLRAMARRILTEAQSCGTAVPIVCVRNGKLTIEPTKAKWCTPTFDAYGELLQLEIRYPYEHKYYDNAARQWAVEALIYRRIIDKENDTTFKPAKAEIDGSEPHFVVNPELTVNHGLGFVPAVWYQFMGEVKTVDEFDGVAPHSHLLDELDALNFSMSQRHRAALYTGDPQYVETGVEESVDPAPDGSTARIIQEPAANGFYSTRLESLGGKPARKKGPGTVWRYPDKDSQVHILTLPGDALQSIKDHIEDIKRMLEESFHVVFIEPASIRYAAELSGVAIERLMSRQITYCDDVRDDAAHGMLLPLMNLLLRMVATISKKNLDIRIPGLQEAAPILEKHLSEDGWTDMDLDVVWPLYFSKTPDDEQKTIATAVLARKAKLIPLQKAVEKIANIFDIEDPTKMAEQLAPEELRQNELDMGGPAVAQKPKEGPVKSGMASKTAASVGGVSDREISKLNAL